MCHRHRGKEVLCEHMPVTFHLTITCDRQNTASAVAIACHTDAVLYLKWQFLSGKRERSREDFTKRERFWKRARTPPKRGGSGFFRFAAALTAVPGPLWSQHNPTSLTPQAHLSV